MASRSLDDLLDSRRRGSTLARLLEQASLREALTAQLRALLPNELREHCEVASIEGPVLTLLTPNAAWATRLRFDAPALLPQLNRLGDFVAIREIRIRIAPHLTEPRQTFQPPAQPPAPDAESLEALARDLGHEGLRNAILRLARHGKTPNVPQSRDP